MKHLAASILLFGCLSIFSCDNKKESREKSLAYKLVGSWEFVRANSYVFQHIQVPFTTWYDIFEDTTIDSSIAKDIDDFYFTDRLIENVVTFTDNHRIFMNVGLEVSNAPRLRNASRKDELSSSNRVLHLDWPRHQRSDLPPPPYQIVFECKGAYSMSDSQLTYVFEDLVIKIQPEDLWGESTTAEIKRAYRGISHKIASANVVLLGNTLTLMHDANSTTVLSRKS